MSGFFKAIVERHAAEQWFESSAEPALQKVLVCTADNFRITPTAVFSMTLAGAANWINKEMANALGKLSNKIITDATAGVGGNTFAFAKVFAHVNAVEIDEITAECLEHNVGVCSAENVTTHNVDYINVMEILEQNVVFIDAPWGGLNYRAADKIDCFLSGVSIAQIVADLSCDVFVKIPMNFDVGKYRKIVKRKTTLIRGNKFHLLHTANKHYGKSAAVKATKKS